MALHVVEPTVSGVHDLERIMATTDHFGIPSLVAINKADLNTDRADEVAAYCSDRGVSVVGRIPYDTIVTEAMVRGLPVTAHADGPVSSALHAIWEEVRKHKVDLVVLAGFMSLLEIPEEFIGRILNIHPALLPSFGGKGMYGHHVHEAVLAYGAKITGATVHFVDAEYDRGPVVLQGAVSVREDDTPDTLAERVQAKERELYVQAIQLFAEGRLKIEGRRVRILEGAS